MTDKRFTIYAHTIDLKEPFTPIKDNGEPITLLKVVELLNDLSEEIELLKQDKDLFAQCICDLSNLLYDNKIEHKLPKDIKDFITVWGVRVE